MRACHEEICGDPRSTAFQSEHAQVDFRTCPAKVMVMRIVREWTMACRLAAGLLAAAFSFDTAMAAPADQAFREGLSAYNSGNFERAMRIWIPLAQGEDPASQAGIGFMYHRGLGVATDNGKAAYWLRKAAEHGQPEGQFMLGSLYFYGAGVEKSYVQAYAWCDLAQDGGNADAQACRDAALQSLASADDQKAAFRLSQDLHKRFRRAH